MEKSNIRDTNEEKPEWRRKGWEETLVESNILHTYIVINLPTEYYKIWRLR
jgi:hypothetical protein